MRQADEIAAQLLGPAQQSPGIVLAPCPSSSLRRLFVNRDSSQEDRLPIQKDVSTMDLDRPKTNQIIYLIRFAGDLNSIEFWVLRRPELEIRRKGEVDSAHGISLKRQ